MDIEKITDVMGLTDDIHSSKALKERIAQGLPIKYLIQTISNITSDEKVAKSLRDKIMSTEACKSGDTSLTIKESERVERIARIYTTTLEIWGDKDNARRFLFTHHPLLNNHLPIEHSLSENGVKAVEKLLEKIRYGLPV